MKTEGRPSRTLGLVVLRGPQITLISPTDGYEGKLLSVQLIALSQEQHPLTGP